MTLTATDLLLEATGVAKTYGAVVALRVGLAGGPARARSTRSWAPTAPARAPSSRS